MNGFKLISSKTIIAEMYSDFNITNDDWVHKAQRHLARALGIMKIDGYYERAVLRDTVKEFKVPLPCDEKYILAVLHNMDNLTRLPLTRNLALGVEFKDIVTNTTLKGGINFNYLRTNFEEGEVMFIYYRVPKDCDGNLLIPDNDDVLEALPYFLIYKLSLSGYKHPVINMDKAYAKWQELYPRARNSMNYPSIEEMHRFTQMWNNPLFLHIIDEDWNTLMSGNGIPNANGINQFENAVTNAESVTPTSIEITLTDSSDSTYLFYGGTENGQPIVYRYLIAELSQKTSATLLNNPIYSTLQELWDNRLTLTYS